MTRSAALLVTLLSTIALASSAGACATAATLADASDGGDAGKSDGASSEASDGKDAAAEPTDAAVDAKVRPDVPGKLVFATGDVHDGNLGGLAGADTLCQKAADAANLGGKFKAYLSDATTSAKARIASVGPWYLPDATKVFPATSVTSFPSRDLDMDENGEGGKKGLVWTGTALGGVSAPANCGDWTSTGESGVSGLAASSDQWADDGTGGSPCNLRGRLYCFEQ